MKGLYAIVDTVLLATRRTDPLEYARAVLDAHPAALQLRAKDLPAREILRLLRALGPLCRRAHVPLVTNDRADLAALAGCETVHIGQEDLPYELVHRIAPQLSVGISTHDLAQLERALAFRPRYVVYGPVYATAARRLPVVGLAGLKAAVELARAAGVPLVASGGVTLDRAPEVAALSDAFLVDADLYPSGATLADVGRRAALFQAIAGRDVVPESAPVPLVVIGAA